MHETKNMRTTSNVCFDLPIQICIFNLSTSARKKDAQDESMTFDSDWGQNREFKCPKFDIFGCGCAELPGYETLNSGDCATLKKLFKQHRDIEYAEGRAMNCVEMGQGKFEIMTKTANAVSAEDPFAFKSEFHTDS